MAALESAGVSVHHQLVVRLLGIGSNAIPSVLARLTDIVHEYTINAREGLYGWKCRHDVIASIIARYKFPDIQAKIDLLASVIDSLAPTYEIEFRSAKQLCSADGGITSIPSKQAQNTLLRKMISAVPGERVPRHRLIKNLLDAGEFEKADTEIRIFEKDFGRADGPLARYKILLMVARATKTSGLLEEDRVSILKETLKYPSVSSS